MHNACYDAYRRSNGKCAACGEDWGRVGNDRVVPVGEAAAPKDDWPRRTRRSATATESDHDDDDGQQNDADADADADAPVVPDRATGPSQASQAPARCNQQRAASGAKLAPIIRKKLSSHLTSGFSVPIIQEWISTSPRSPHEQGDGVKAGVVDMADCHVVEELRGTGAPRNKVVYVPSWG